MEQLVNQITQVVAPYLPRLASALGILNRRLDYRRHCRCSDPRGAAAHDP